MTLISKKILLALDVLYGRQYSNFVFGFGPIKERGNLKVRPGRSR